MSRTQSFAVLLVLALLAVASSISVKVFGNGQNTAGASIDITPEQVKSTQSLAAYLSTIAAIGYNGDRVIKENGELISSFDQLQENDALYVMAPGMEFKAPQTQAPQTDAPEVSGIVAKFINKYEAPLEIYRQESFLYRLEALETKELYVHDGEDYLIKDAEGEIVFEHRINQEHGISQEFQIPGGITIEFQNHFEDLDVDVYWFETLHGQIPPMSKLIYHVNNGDEFTLADSEGNILVTHIMKEEEGEHQFIAVPLEIHEQLRHEEL